MVSNNDELFEMGSQCIVVEVGLVAFFLIFWNTEFLLLYTLLFVTLTLYVVLRGFHGYYKDILQREPNFVAIFGLGLLHLSIPITIWYEVEYGFTWLERVTVVAAAMFGGLGVTLGLHRMAVHGSFQCRYEWMRWMLFSMASLSGQKPSTWIVDHWDHHDASDEAKDVHSPYFPFNGGLKGAWHAHMGWILHKYVPSSRNQSRLDRKKDAAIRWVSVLHPVIFLGGIFIPGIFWGYPGILLSCLRVLIAIHGACSVNSICHMIGKRVDGVRDQSRNNRWLSVITLGESFHAYHHQNQSRAAHGINRFDVDITKWVIIVLEYYDLIHNVKWQGNTPLKVIKRA